MLPGACWPERLPVHLEKTWLKDWSEASDNHCGRLIHSRLKMLAGWKWPFLSQHLQSWANARVQITKQIDDTDAFLKTLSTSAHKSTSIWWVSRDPRESKPKCTTQHSVFGVTPTNWIFTKGNGGIVEWRHNIKQIPCRLAEPGCRQTDWKYR